MAPTATASARRAPAATAPFLGASTTAAAAVRAGPAATKVGPLGPTAGRMGLGLAHRREPAGGGGGGRTAHRRPGPAVVRAGPGGLGDRLPEVAPSLGGPEDGATGCGRAGREPGVGRSHPGGVPAPSAAQRAPPRSPYDAPPGAPGCVRSVPGGHGFRLAGAGVRLLHRNFDCLRRPVSPSILLGRRTRAIRLVIVLVFLALAAQLVHVQEFSHGHYASLSASQLTHTVSVPAVRGGIFDRNGEVLAESVVKQTVVADPMLITRPAATVAALSPVLGIPADQLRSELTERSGFVYLAHRVPDAEANAVSSLGPDRDQPRSRVAAGRARRAAGRSGGRLGQLGREWVGRARVPVPEAPGRHPRVEEPAPGAGRGGAARKWQDGGGPSGDRRRAHHRPVDPVHR